LKLLEPGSLNTCKNVVASMIVMLGCLEIDTEVSDIGIETMKSNNCREMSRDDRDANDILTVMWEGARFSCKDRQKFINLFI